LILQVGNETNSILCKLCFAGILDFQIISAYHSTVRRCLDLILQKFGPSRIISGRSTGSWKATHSWK